MLEATKTMIEAEAVGFYGDFNSNGSKDVLV